MSAKNSGADEDEPVSMMVGDYDILNLPGKVRKRLIQTGKIAVDSFTTPANMPGKKLKALRDSNRKAMLGDAEGTSLPTDPVFNVGDKILYKEESYEVLEIDELRVKVFKDDKNKWINKQFITKG